MTDRSVPESPMMDRTPSSPAQRIQPPRPRPQSSQPLDQSSSAPRSHRSGSSASQSSTRPQAQAQSRQPSQTTSRQSSQQALLAQQPSRQQSASPTPSSNQQSRPPLEPFFALVQNSTSQTTHHPRVHYIFSDDDDNEALAQALNHSAHRHHAQQPFDRSNQGSEEGSRDSLAQGYRDRAVLLELDVGEDGKWKVAQANSLSSDWAVVRAEVAQMGDDDGGRTRGGQQEDAEEGKLMLVVEGVEGAGNSPLIDGSLALDGSRGSGRSEVTQGDYGALVDEFEKRMGVLRRVVDRGEERKKDEGGERTELEVLKEESAEGEK